MKTHKTQNGFVRAVKKFLLSAFVVVTFTAYALENRTTPAGRVAQVAGGVVPTPTLAPAAAAGAPPDAAPSSAAAAPTAATGTDPSSAPAAPTSAPAPTAAPAATSTPALAKNNGLKDGTYTGPVVDVNWGYVQIQATVQAGKISDVRFLQYPSDRRTSVRINQIADPELQQEAIQAQSANVDIISGATLTSEGFQMSLQYALNQAKS